MRYGNWDVLLFPHGSKTPVQEFRTQCFVTRDNDVPFIHDPSFSGVRYISEGRPLTQLPVLTTFVGSLVHDAPFRVSIHSWELPKGSRMLESLARAGDAVTFEARVYIDGVLFASSLFNHRSDWPHVIDLCSRKKLAALKRQEPGKLTASEVDREGYQEPLRFPPFHQEILHASSWDAGQLLGRIRVVMTEGFSRETGSPQIHLKHSYIRVRDVCAFSFQHAPMHILEFSGIAWPNPGMWTHAQSRNEQSPAPGIQHPFASKAKGREEPHAHSPRGPDEQKDPGSEGQVAKCNPDFEDYLANMNMPPPQRRFGPTGWTQSLQGEPSLVRPNRSLADPFLEPPGKSGSSSRRSQLKKFSEDTPMPDVPNSEPIQAITGMDGMGVGPKKLGAINSATHEAIMKQLVEALGPLEGDEGTQINPSTSTDTSTTPSSGSTCSDLALSGPGPVSFRQVSRCQAPSPSTGTDITPNRDSGNEVTTNTISTAKTVISSIPGNSVQSKKEGDRENMTETRVAGADYTQRTISISVGGVMTATAKSTEKKKRKKKKQQQEVARSTDSKRKRPLEEEEEDDEDEADISPRIVRGGGGDATPQSSPSKRVSKMGSAERLRRRSRLPHTPEYHDARGGAGGVAVEGS